MLHGNPEASGARSINRAIDGRLADARPEQTDWSDEALMTAIAARDDSAFSVLYDRYAELVFSTSLRVLGDAHLAEDATQDVFVRLWKRPDTFVADRGRFLTWLMSVARNRAVDELRARGRRSRREAAQVESGDDTGLPAALLRGDEDPQQAAQLHEERALVRRALSELPGEQRIALELAYFGGLTQQEIAVALDEPLGTVKTRIRLGMQKLRRRLEPSLGT